MRRGIPTNIFTRANNSPKGSWIAILGKYEARFTRPQIGERVYKFNIPCWHETRGMIND
jgi:hypothetical protein